MKTVRDLIDLPKGYRSREAASFMAQLDELTDRLRNDVRGLSARDLEWRPAPGTNSIGMLLAHLAIVEVAWIGGVLAGERPAPFERVLGIGPDDDGLPAKIGAPYPAALRGRNLAFHLGLLAKSRRFVQRVSRRVTEAEIGRRERRQKVSVPEIQIYNRRWILYHVLEHFGGHYGQILLLKHLMKTERAKPLKRRRARVSLR